MTGFVLGAMLLGALAVLMLRPNSRGHGSSTPHAATAQAASLGILKQELERLDLDLAEGRLAHDQHAGARQELQRRVLAEAEGEAPAARPGDPRKTWLGSAAAVTLFAFVAYGFLGNREALSPNPATALATPSQAATEQTPPARNDDAAAAVQQMVDNLAQRLETEPALAQDVGAWTMLARSYAAMQRFPEADKAYARAIALTPRDPQLLADRADVLAMLQGRRAAGEPERLIEEALRLQPDNLKALALAGSAAYERNDVAAAIDFWQRARDKAPAGSEFAAGLDRSLADARGVAGTAGKAGAAAGSAGIANNAGATSATTAAPASITGRVSIAPSLAARVAPTDTVFITARAATGPRMPLAVLRRTAGELPFDFKLDDSMAMSPEFTLSKYPNVVVTARVSRSGNAMPATGDPVVSVPVEVGARAPVGLLIDTLQP